MENLMNYQNPLESGSSLWRDWNFPSTDGRGIEYLMWSDREFIDSCGSPNWEGPRENFGPIVIYSTCTGTYPTDSLRPSLAVKMKTEYCEPIEPEWAALHSQQDTGLSSGEEISSLISLLLDVRMRSGGPVRIFPAGGDPSGFPWYGHHAPPSTIGPLIHARVLPSPSNEEVSLLGCDPMLSSFGILSPIASTVLVKAAHHYANGLWIAEEDPEQAWLQLVTALEVVAVHHQTETIDATDIFRIAYPGATKKIIAAGGVDLLNGVAKDFKRLLSAGRRVQTFVETFRPSPPSKRPTAASDRVDWADDLIDNVRTVYSLRSRLLHSGAPFPAPLVAGIGGLEVEEGDYYPERPAGTWGSGQSEWDDSELPMHLHVFAHVVRVAILNWWRESIPSD
ncbi:hypothetical protein ACWGIB_23785 [Streptomyces xiamenensis]